MLGPTKRVALLALTTAMLAGCSAGSGAPTASFATLPTSGVSAQDAMLEGDGTIAAGIMKLKRHKFAPGSSTLARITGASSDQVQQLVNGGADLIFRKGIVAIADVPNKAYQQLKTQAGVQVTPIGPAEGTSIIENDYDPRYRTYAQLTSQLQSLAARHADIMQLQDIGDTFEKTKGKANRDIWAVKLTSKKSAAAKPGIVFMGCHHARELVSSEVPLKLIEFLTDSYGKDADVTNWLDTSEVWIIPMVNPDGHVKAEQGHDWRKNTNPGGRLAEEGPEGQGVDLNRNYPFKWGDVGSSRDPNSAIYGGPAPFSEPETQAIREFYRSHRNLKLSLSYHSFSNIILYPWAHTHTPTPDKALFEKIAGRMGQLSGYEPEQSSELYLHSGEANDWIYSEFKIPAFTAEIGGFEDGFDPPYARMDDFWKQMLPVARYLISITPNPKAVLQ